LNKSKNYFLVIPCLQFGNFFYIDYDTGGFILDARPVSIVFLSATLFGSFEIDLTKVPI